MKNKKFNLTYFSLALLAVLLIQNFWNQHQNISHIPYSEFKKQLKNGNIQKVQITENKINGFLNSPIEDNKKQFSTNRVEHDLVQQLENSQVEYNRVIENTFFRTLLSWLLPALIFFGLWMFLITRMAGRGGGFMTVGKSKAKVYVETDTKVSFKDVAGVDEAKTELAEVVEFLKNPKEYGVLGARLPKGILLVGPPGTGKTLMAKAVAGEAGVPFFSISGSEFVEMFVGVGAARVRDLFEQARAKSPCIIFIDELDALGKTRSIGMSGGHDEKEQTLNQLLVELDGFDTKSGIVLLGATNRPEILDPALLRAGRFDRQVLVDRPDKVGRVQILKVHLEKIKADQKLDLEQIAALTPGFTGADLANLINEAALMATRRKSHTVCLEDFNQAIERIVAGLEKKNRLLNPKEREVVAHHEMGHAIVASSLPDTDPVHKISIIPRGIGALGYTIQRPTEDRFLMGKEELINKISVLLGGRVAESIIFNHLSTGASDDIQKATEIAKAMVMKYGMIDKLGHVNYETQSSYNPQIDPNLINNFSQSTRELIDSSIKEIIDQAYENAYQILSDKRDLLVTSAALLLEKETLEGKELENLLS